MNDKFIEEPILADIKSQVDTHFETRGHTQKDKDDYTIGLMCEKIIELNDEKEGWKKAADRNQ